MPWCPECGAEYREGFETCSECGVALVATPPPVPSPGPAWVAVAAFTTAEEAELAQGLLAAEGIESQVVDRQMHVQPYGMSLLEEVELHVAPENVARAEEVLDAADAGRAEARDEDVEEPGGEG